MKKMPDKQDLPEWQIEESYKNAANILASEGGEMEESPHDYQCFTFKTGDVSLVFYPHRTTSRNYHIRVRDQGSKNKPEANRIMRMLDEGAGYNCTFTRKFS